MPKIFAFPSLGGFELLGIAFWVWMIYECVMRERDPRTRLFWLLIVCLLGPVGALVYFFVRLAKIGG